MIKSLQGILTSSILLKKDKSPSLVNFTRPGPLEEIIVVHFRNLLFTTY